MLTEISIYICMHVCMYIYMTTLNTCEHYKIQMNTNTHTHIETYIKVTS